MKYLKTILFAILVLVFSGCDDVENIRPFNSDPRFGYSTSQTPTKNVQFMLEEKNTIYIPAGMKIVAISGDDAKPHTMVLEDINGNQFILHRCNNHIIPIKEVE
jgi:hypothetical protein